MLPGTAAGSEQYCQGAFERHLIPGAGHLPEEAPGCRQRAPRGLAGPGRGLGPERSACGDLPTTLSRQPLWRCSAGDAGPRADCAAGGRGRLEDGTRLVRRQRVAGAAVVQGLREDDAHDVAGRRAEAAGVARRTRAYRSTPPGSCRGRRRCRTPGPPPPRGRGRRRGGRGRRGGTRPRPRSPRAGARAPAPAVPPADRCCHDGEVTLGSNRTTRPAYEGPVPCTRRVTVRIPATTWALVTTRPGETTQPLPSWPRLQASATPVILMTESAAASTPGVRTTVGSGGSTGAMRSASSLRTPGGSPPGRAPRGSRRRRRRLGRHHGVDDPQHRDSPIARASGAGAPPRRRRR